MSYSVTISTIATFRNRSTTVNTTGISNSVINAISMAQLQMIPIIYQNLNVPRGYVLRNIQISLVNNEYIPAIPNVIKSGNVQKVLTYLNANNIASGAPFSAYVFGNAFTGEEVFMGAGIGQQYNPSGQIINKPITSDMYFRWASSTKLLGMLIFCKALEDGLIGSIDDPVYKYVPEVGQITDYISGSTAQLDINGNIKLDIYGSPSYIPIITTTQNIGQTMTIRHLLNYNSGLGYNFYSLGYTRQTYLTDQPYTDLSTGITYTPPYTGTNYPPNDTPFANYIAQIQSMETAPLADYSGTGSPPYNSLNADIFTSYYYNQQVTFTDAILSRCQYPLLNIPGETNVCNYGSDLNMLGAVISGALQNAGQNITSAQYCQEQIFTPLGMNNTWITCGGLAPPANAQTNMVDACFYRYTDNEAGYNLSNEFNAQSADPSGQNPPYYNTVNVSSNPTMQNDGFVRQANGQVYHPFVGYPLDKYAGGYAESGVGPLTDYSKLLKLILNKGIVYTIQNGIKIGTRILNAQSIGYLLTPKVGADANNPYNGVWACGAGTVSFAQPQETWASGFTVTDPYKGQNLPIGISSTTHRWQSYWGHHCYWDTVSGNYLMGGCESSFASWPTITAPNTSYEPDYLYIWQIMTLQNN